MRWSRPDKRTAAQPMHPPEDHGFMYQRTIADPDGHIWEPFWMDDAQAEASLAGAA